MNKRLKQSGNETKKHGPVNTFTIALVIGFIFIGLGVAKEFRNLDLGFIDVLEQKMLDLKFLTRGVIPTQDKVVIAAVDEKSMEKYGLWPWNRRIVADLVKKLDEKGARVIAFDVIFGDEDRTSVKRNLMEMRQALLPDVPSFIEDDEDDDYDDEDEEETAEDTENTGSGAVAKPAPIPPLKENLARKLDAAIVASDSDAALAAAIEETSEKTVLGFFIFSGQETKVKRMLSELDQKRLNEDLMLMATSKINVFNNLVEKVPTPPYPSGPALRAPLPVFAEQTDNFGHFSFQPDRDGTLRWTMLVHRVENPKDPEEVILYPSLALKTAGVYLGGEDHSVVVNTYDAGVYSVSLRYVDQKTQQHESVELSSDAYGRMLIDHHGPKGTFPHYSVADILEDKPFVDVKDKVVIIGVTAIAVYDLRVTPFQETFPGVEVHANIVDSILAEKFIGRPYYWAWLVELGVMLLFAMLFGWAIHRLPAAYSAFIIVLFVAGFLIIDRYYLFAAGHVIRSVLPLSEALVIILVCYVFRYFTEERERIKIRHMFGHYLNDDIIRELEDDPDKMKLGGERKELTMLFSDLAGFTSISEHLAPDDLTKLLNQYLTPMTHIVFEHQGLLDKYIGDAVMALFGTPHEEDHALRSCEAACSMQHKIAELAPVWAAHGIDDFHARVGLNSGMVSVGNMGSEIRFDYTVIGDAVNLAARLEGINKQYGTRICMSQFTFAQVKGRVVARELDRVRVKGKNEPVTIYELIAMGQPDARQEKWTTAFEEALDAYRNQDWETAATLFETVAMLREEADPPSEVYLRRVSMLRQDSPGEDWDGVWTMTTK